MKYVKKNGVVKEVSDALEGDYISAGWKPAEKSEFERKVKPEKSVPSDTQETNR